VPRGRRNVCSWAILAAYLPLVLPLTPAGGAVAPCCSAQPTTAAADLRPCCRGCDDTPAPERDAPTPERRCPFCPYDVPAGCVCFACVKCLPPATAVVVALAADVPPDLPHEPVRVPDSHPAVVLRPPRA
jgi:hypothetical protein